MLNANYYPLGLVPYSSVFNDSLNQNGEHNSKVGSLPEAREARASYKFGIVNSWPG